MSQNGIKAAASLFAHMQQLRIDLLGSDNEDIFLGQMVEKGKDAMKDDFARLTSDPRVDKVAAASEKRRRRSARQTSP